MIEKTPSSFPAFPSPEDMTDSSDIAMMNRMGMKDLAVFIRVLVGVIRELNEDTVFIAESKRRGRPPKNPIQITRTPNPEDVALTEEEGKLLCSLLAIRSELSVAAQPNEVEPLNVVELLSSGKYRGLYELFNQNAGLCQQSIETPNHPAKLKNPAYSQAPIK